IGQEQIRLPGPHVFRPGADDRVISLASADRQLLAFDSEAAGDVGAVAADLDDIAVARRPYRLLQCGEERFRSAASGEQHEITRRCGMMRDSGRRRRTYISDATAPASVAVRGDQTDHDRDQRKKSSHVTLPLARSLLPGISAFAIRNPSPHE